MYSQFLSTTIEEQFTALLISEKAAVIQALGRLTFDGFKLRDR